MRADSATGTSKRSSRRSSASRRSAETSRNVTLFDLIRAPARQAASLDAVAHRPWPLPESPWRLGQTWDDLLFAHWRVDADAVREHLPPDVELDLHDGSAWLGVTPFVLGAFRLRGAPPLPGSSTFLEVNVRTYVTADGKPGVWFFSLDATSRRAVLAARSAYRLPYHLARISLTRSGDSFSASCSRRGTDRPRVFTVRAREAGPAEAPRPGTLEHFLTERYCLYTVHRTRLHRAEIHHGPWLLHPAEGGVELNTLPPPGLQEPAGPPLLHLAQRQDVLVWPLEPVPL